MNRHFFADKDQEAKEVGRCHEVELLRDYMKSKLQSIDQSGVDWMNDKTKNLAMFVDIHAHSTLSSIFLFAPEENEESVGRKFAEDLDGLSEYFSLQNCSYNCEKSKRNCARLGIYRDYNLNDSYTIESSCYGFQPKKFDR
jgi:hypothetical protein